MDTLLSWLLPLVALLGAPLLHGIIGRTRAWVAGRQGPPLFQPYVDLRKLMMRGAVYSDSCSWVLRLAPVLGLAALMTALWMTPLGDVAAPVAFSGDAIVVAGLLGAGVFLTLLAALDTGSSFEGMGASREAHFGALAEASLFLTLAALAHLTNNTSLSAAYATIDTDLWHRALPMLIMVAVSFLILTLVENSRMPIDDPHTHLELTMIHEVMVLDHTGPDLGFILYASSLKLWLLSSLVVGIIIPVNTGNLWMNAIIGWAGMGVLAIIIGLISALMARLHLKHTPPLIVGAGALSAVALMMAVR